MIRTVATLALIVASAQAANAWGNNSNNTPRIDQRQHFEYNRIERGYENGSLTRRETQGLLRREQDIRSFERLAKSDGRVTPDERRILRHMENSQDRSIYRESHDHQVRRPWWRLSWW